MNLFSKRKTTKKVFSFTVLLLFLNSFTSVYALSRVPRRSPEMQVERPVAKPTETAEVQFAGSGMVPVYPEIFDNLDLQEIFRCMIREAEESEIELPDGVYRCYEMMRDGQDAVPCADLEDAFPCLVYKLLYDMPMKEVVEMTRAPRPDAIGLLAPNAIVGKNECDLTQVLGVLFKIKKLLINCCEDLCRKFQETWTILEEIRDDIFDTKTVLCEKFEETWTILEEVRDDIFDTKTVLCQKFEETWTILADIDEDIEDCCNLLEEEIIFTRTLLCSKFEQTWTILEDIDGDIQEGFSGTFSVLNEIQEDQCGKFNETWTILADIDGDIEDCCNLLEEEIIFTRTLLCSKFGETWTILEDLEAAARGIEECCEASLIILESTTTVLDNLCEKINDGFGGTFTVLDRLEFEVDLSGVYTVLDELCNKFNETWTILDELDVNVDLSGVFTVLDDCCNDLESEIVFTRTLLCDKFNETFTILDNFEDKVCIALTGIHNELERQCAVSIRVTEPMIINEPGSYCLMQDIVGTITIATSCVKLDLNGFKISALPGDDAIEASSVADIEITNGKICSPSGDGIGLNQVTSIQINNITFMQNGVTAIRGANNMRGIEVDGCIFRQNNQALFFSNMSQDIKIRRCQFYDNTTVSTPLVRFAGSSDIVVEDCCVNNNSLSSGGNAIGVDQSSGVEINNCQLNDNIGSVGSSLVVIKFLQSDNCTVAQTELHSNTLPQGSPTSDCVAIGVEESSGITIKECLAHDTSIAIGDGGSIMGNLIAGFFVETSTGVCIIDSQVKNVQDESFATGIRVENAPHTLLSHNTIIGGSPATANSGIVVTPANTISTLNNYVENVFVPYTGAVPVATLTKSTGIFSPAMPNPFVNIAAL